MEEHEESTAQRVDRQVARLERRRPRAVPSEWLFAAVLLAVSALTFFVVAWPLVVACAIAAPLVWWRGVRRRRRLAAWRERLA